MIKRYHIVLLIILAIFIYLKLGIFKNVPLGNFEKDWASKKFQVFVINPIPEGITILGGKKVSGMGYNFSIEFEADEKAFQKVIHDYKEIPDCHLEFISIEENVSYSIEFLLI